jgi:hypothetical protein
MTVTTVKNIFGEIVGTTGDLVQFLQSNGAVQLDLRDVCLRYADLTGIDFSGAWLDYADFMGSIITKCIFINASVRYARFSECTVLNKFGNYDIFNANALWYAYADNAVSHYYPGNPEYSKEYVQPIPSLQSLFAEFYPFDNWREFYDIFNSGDYLQWSIDNDTSVSYSPPGVSATDHKRRRKTKLARYMIRQRDISHTSEQSKAIEQIVAAFPLNSEFELLRGNDIIEAYRKSVGCSSCMAGHGKSHLIRLYARNPEKISLLVWRKDRGRALVWNCDDGTVYIDRIYAGDSAAKSAYEGWAKKNNAMTYGNRTHHLRCTLSNVDLERVPYMDSFITCDDDGCFYTSGRGCYDCQTTEGDVTGGSACDDCGGRIDPDYSYHIEFNGHNVCESCANEYPCCSNCSEACESTTCIEDTGDSVCDNCLVNGDYSFCDDCNNYVSCTTHVEGFNISACDSCLESYEECDCGHYVEQGDSHENYYGNNTCADCHDGHDSDADDCGCKDCIEDREEDEKTECNDRAGFPLSGNTF